MTNPHFYALQVCGLLPPGITSADDKAPIAKWQEAHGLVADGSIGPATADAMHLAASPNGSTLHFTLDEYRDGLTIPAACLPNARRTLRQCEVRRLVVFGGVPCVIVCGLRDPSKPRTSGQAKHSQHYPFAEDGKTPLCRAADMSPATRGTGTPYAQWRELTLEAMKDGRLEPGGFNVYTDQAVHGEFIHTDWRGYIVDGW